MLTGQEEEEDDKIIITGLSVKFVRKWVTLRKNATSGTQTKTIQPKETTA